MKNNFGVLLNSHIMRQLIFSILLSGFGIICAQSTLQLETLIGKDTSSVEFSALMAETKMQDLQDWQRKLYGEVVEKYWIFKGSDYTCRIKAVKVKNGFTVQELTFLKPGGNSPKVKGGTCKSPVPFGLHWSMTEADMKKSVGYNTNPWIKYKNYELQLVIDTKSKERTLSYFLIKAAPVYAPPPPVYVPDPTESYMVKVIAEAEKQGARMHRKESIPFAPNEGPMQSSKQIPFTIPVDAKYYFMYVMLEHTIGANVYIKDQEGKFYPCDLMPGNSNYLIYAPKAIVAPGKSMTIYVASSNTSVHSKVTVYYFRDK
jgi:hypothetical protein